MKDCRASLPFLISKALPISLPYQQYYGQNSQEKRIKANSYAYKVKYCADRMVAVRDAVFKKREPFGVSYISKN